MHAAELSILLHRALAARVAVLTDLLGAPGWQDDSERLRQVRVASRRVRSVLALVRPGIYPAFRHEGRKLRGFTRSLGLTRELDVHAECLERLAGSVPGLATGSALEHALEVLEVRRRKARKAMARDLAGRPLRHLEDLLNVPSLPEPFLAGNLAEETWAGLDPLLEGAFSPLPGLTEREDPAALHRARIRIKRFRYTLEVLGAAFPSPPEGHLARLKDLQGALGRHHDRAALEGLLQELHGGLAARGRRTLASGTLEVLAYVGELRLQAFEEIRTTAGSLPLEPFRASLRALLGLPEEDTL